MRVTDGSKSSRPATAGRGRLVARASWIMRVTRAMLLASRFRGNGDEVLDHGERLVEVVQQLAPARVPGRRPEPDLVRLDGVPPDEQEVGVGVLDAARDLDPAEPRDARHQRGGP